MSKNIIQHIIQRARELQATQMQGLDEPEIGFNEETRMITINRYNPEYQAAFHIEDVCRMDDINIEDLRKALNKTSIGYCL